MAIYYFFMKSHDELVWLASAGNKKASDCWLFHSGGKRETGNGN
jgi:hypothetical protein